MERIRCIKKENIWKQIRKLIVNQRRDSITSHETIWYLSKTEKLEYAKKEKEIILNIVQNRTEGEEKIEGFPYKGRNIWRREANLNLKKGNKTFGLRCSEQPANRRCLSYFFNHIPQFNGSWKYWNNGSWKYWNSGREEIKRKGGRRKNIPLLLYWTDNREI